MSAATYAEVLGTLSSDAAISRDEVRRWIETGDLLTWSAVYVLMRDASSRIEPEIASDEQVEFMRRYLLRCIEENPASGEHLHGGYDAAWELAARLKHWRVAGDRFAGALRGIALDLETLYRRSEAPVKNRILCGVLEHAFEDAALRPYFANWDRDDELREAYKLAVEWGAAHEK